jgi:hypothetical protein
MVSRFPRLRIVGSAFSHLLDSLPQAAQAVVREGWMDLVGLGRILLSYCTGTFPATVCAARRGRRNASAAPSATAPRRRETGW